MIEIRSIQDGDMEFVRANAFESAVKRYPELTAPADSFTCLFEGEIVAIGGVADLWQGVGEAWLMMTEQAKKHGIYGLIAFNTIERKMNELIVKHKHWRTEANVRADFPEAIKFIEAVGFEREGVRRKYTPDKCDMILYSRITDE